ncbi:MAG TPA: hypothetical protein VJZ27_07345, partial [Aggregatilineales bacterium]|nr:hypothetical protein [Aggregatilineales bacterium]
FYSGKVGISGKRLAKSLQARRIVIEKAEQQTILFLVPFQRTHQDVLETVQAIRASIVEQADSPPDRLPLMPTSFRKLKDPFEVGKLEFIPLAKAARRIAGENITPYPPGVPLVIRGEEIKTEHIDYIESLRRTGNSVLMYDSAVERVLVEVSE